MLYYPKIQGSANAPDGRCIAFEKLDGTNLHWVWDRDFGWHAFGTRRDRFNLTTDGIEQFTAKHAHLREAPSCFLERMSTELDAVFRKQSNYATVQEVTVFTEFLGQSSFAGLHKSDETKRVVLIDVLMDNARFVFPDSFVEDFGCVEIPRVIYRGKLTGAIIERVRRGDFDVDEGVVCKGVNTNGELWMVKIKTAAYLEKLKQAFAERWDEYWE